MDWQLIKTITPDAGKVLFYGYSYYQADTAFTGWIAQNGHLYSDVDGLNCAPTHWCKITSPDDKPDEDAMALAGIRPVKIEEAEKAGDEVARLRDLLREAMPFIGYEANVPDLLERAQNLLSTKEGE